LSNIGWESRHGKINVNDLPEKMDSLDESIRIGQVIVTVTSGNSYTLTFVESDYILETAFYYLENSQYDATICYKPNAGWNLDVREGPETIERMTDIRSIETNTITFN
jgi:hypothetical protein